MRFARVSTHAGKPGKTGKSAFFQKHATKTGKYILFNLCMLEKLEKNFFKYQMLLFNKLGHFDVVILSFVESNGQIWYNYLCFSNILLLNFL